MKKNLILGLAAGYSWTQLRTFVESIRNTSYNDHIVLFFDSELDPYTIQHLRENSVECIYFNRQQAIARTGRPVTVRLPNQGQSE